MLNIVVINGGNTGSTGTVISGIGDIARNKGYRYYFFSPPGRSQRKNVPDNIFFGSIIERRSSEKINFMTGYLDSLNYLATKQLLRIINKIEPDIVHLHNLHGNYINIKLLFNYLKNNQIRTVWTLHDCWAFTAQCTHFAISNCEKWKRRCYQCSSIGEYPASLSDRSEALYKKKKRLFTGINEMIIVTPSEWLRGLINKSFLRAYPVKLINNGIDINIFRPRSSNFRTKYQLEDKYIILGVSPMWEPKKGLDRFEHLAEILDERFKIVLVGNIKAYSRSHKIIWISHTNNQVELAEIYTAANIFLNATREDNFPTVNIEALACGTPVLSFGAGGSAEAFDGNSGMEVNDENVVEVLEDLYVAGFKEESCVCRGIQFEKNLKYKEYIELYENMSGMNSGDL